MLQRKTKYAVINLDSENVLQILVSKYVTCPVCEAYVDRNKWIAHARGHKQIESRQSCAVAE
jgi:hypothetical protein